MARFVDASETEMFYQYTVPHCRKQLADGTFDAMRNEILADVEAFKLRHAASELADRDARLERNLAQCRARWVSANKSEAFARKAVGQ